ncbi:N-acetylmuramoyl-L-alanine amidase [Paenibacillus sp.]
MNRKRLTQRIIISIAILIAFITALFMRRKDLTDVFHSQILSGNTVVIDAGHGGIDGGAVSCTGTFESNINLEIALKLDDLMHILGLRTIMIRDTDKSIHTEGETIAGKKVSDIRNRVQTINTTPGALLISIHQNSFPDQRYSGAQIFHNDTENSRELAAAMQNAMREYINPQNRRQIKRAAGVYLMDHINCDGLLIECGFLSNETEERLLRSIEYQNKLCCVIATVVSQYLNT